MSEVASAYVSLLPSAKGFGSKLDSQISGDVNSSGKKAGLGFGKLFAAGAALGLGAKAFSFLSDSLGEATEAAVIGSRTENVIEKMGNAAGISAKKVGDLAGAISNKTGIDDEAIQSGQNLLLTFGNIRNEAGKGNDIFSQTSQLMVDMSAAMGTDAKGSAIQLGKALNDPVKGITALSRVGVSFTEGQKEQIAALVKTGDTMGAQKVILAELEKQFGGAAAAMTTPAQKAEVAYGNLKEQVGTALLPVVNRLSKTFTNDVIPAISGFISEMQSGKGKGGEFRAILEKVGTTVKQVAGFIKDNGAAVTVLVGVLGTAYAAFQTFMFIKNVTTAVKAFNLVLRANPIGLVVTAIALLAAGLVLAYKKSDTFRAIVDGAFKAIAKAGKALWESALKPAFEGIKKGFEAVGKAGVWLWNNALQPAFKFIIGGVASILDMWAAMLRTLSKVPGFGWAAGAADAMGAAAGKARELADGIKKIPTTKSVAVTVRYSYVGLRGNTTRGSGGDPLDSILPRMAPGESAKAKFIKAIKSYGDLTKKLLDTVTKGLRDGGKGPVKAAAAAFDKLNGTLEAKRDGLRSTLEGLQSDFQSLVDSVAGAFTGDLFGVTATEATAASEGVAAVAGRSVGQNFIDNLMGKRGELTNLLASFQTLQGWGIDPSFLSQLFASGNGGLITELAGMGQAGATGAAALFGEVTSLGNQLGNAVATNDPISSRIDTTNQKLGEVVQALNYLNGGISDKLEKAVEKGAEKGTRAGNDDRTNSTRQRERAGR